VDRNALTFPNYAVSDAARYTRLPYSTVLYWTKGDGSHRPVLRMDRLLSFMNLVEVHMLGVFRRQHGVSLQRLRRVVSALARKFPGERHPLATRRFWTLNKDVLVETLGVHESLSEPGQAVFPGIVECFSRRVQWDGSVPRRLFPFPVSNVEQVQEHDYPKNIAIDPNVVFGKPFVVGTRITTSVLFERFSAGESPSFIAKDHELTVDKVEDAIRCEVEVRRAG